jgi:hypothetical protein
MTDKTGGNAFPQTFNKTEEDGRVATITRYGMTLRDYFAAKAMQGIVANPNAQGLSYEAISMRAFAQADAMMKAREQ